jgi:hypothetical protein
MSFGGSGHVHARAADGHLVHGDGTVLSCASLLVV